MISFSTRGYRFELRFTDQCRTKTLPRARALSTLRKTLQCLPTSELKRFLSKSSLHRLNLLFVGTRRIHTLNKKYRGKDRPTDVLSFSRIEPGELPALIFPEVEVGDVILCPQVAIRNAQGDGTPRITELNKLIIHGVLHVFGYDHEKDPKAARRMFRLQDQILAKIIP